MLPRALLDEMTNDPAFTFTAPPKSNSALTLPTSTTWYDVDYFETTAQYLATSASGGTGSGATFDVTLEGRSRHSNSNDWKLIATAMFSFSLIDSNTRNIIRIPREVINEIKG